MMSAEENLDDLELDDNTVVCVAHTSRVCITTSTSNFQSTNFDEFTQVCPSQETPPMSVPQPASDNGISEEDEVSKTSRVSISQLPQVLPASTLPQVLPASTLPQVLPDSTLPQVLPASTLPQVLPASTLPLKPVLSASPLPLEPVVSSSLLPAKPVVSLASGLFGNDESTDLFSITSTSNPQLASNSKSTSAVSLFSTDSNNTDDFLKKDIAITQAKPYANISQNVKENVPYYSSVATLNSFNTNDYNTTNTFSQIRQPGTLNYISPANGALNPLQSTTSPIGGNTFSLHNTFHDETELLKTRNETEYQKTPENFIHSSFPHLQNTPKASPYSSLTKYPLAYNNSNNAEIELKQHDIVNTPLMYNPTATPLSCQPSGFAVNPHPTNERNKSNDYLQITSSISNVSNPVSPPKDTTSPLFIPQMYCTSTKPTAPSYFVPENVVQTSPVQRLDGNTSFPAHQNTPFTPHQNTPFTPHQNTPFPAHQNTPFPPHQNTPFPAHQNTPFLPHQNTSIAAHPNNNSPPYGAVASPEMNHFDISPLGYEGESQGDKGILEWLKNTVIKDWPAGAHNFTRYMKNATNSVLTTLDPGMREYLKPGIQIGVASQSIQLLVGIKDGFTKALHAVPVIQGHPTDNVDAPLLPMGFERAIQITRDRLDYLTSVNFEFHGEYSLISSQVFLTELVAGKWYVMFCLGLKDVYKNICLHTFSQPIPLPLGCIEAVYNHMVHNERGECVGYNIAIDDVVRQHTSIEKNWCAVLANIAEHEIISAAVQCLALDYQRHLANVNVPQEETYRQNTNHTNYTNTATNAATNTYTGSSNQHSVCLDAFG